MEKNVIYSHDQLVEFYKRASVSLEKARHIWRLLLIKHAMLDKEVSLKMLYSTAERDLSLL